MTPPPRTQRSVFLDTASAPSWWGASEASHCFHRKQTIMLLVNSQHLSTLHPATMMSIKSCDSPLNSSPGQQRQLPGQRQKRASTDVAEVVRTLCQGLSKCHSSKPQGAAPKPAGHASCDHLGHTGSSVMLQDLLWGKEAMSACRALTTFDRPSTRRSVSVLQATQDQFVQHK